MAHGHIIPKEQLTAFERWEMSQFSQHDQPARPSPTTATVLPTADQIERLYQQGYQEGFETGQRDGKAQAATQIDHIRQAMDGLSGELAKADGAIANEVLMLAMDIAKHMMRQALAVKPEILLAVVQEAIRQLPPFTRQAQLILHPGDAAVVRTHMLEELEKLEWILVEDLSIQRGGCRIETATGGIDATMQTRWQRIATALGRDDPWLA